MIYYLMFLSAGILLDFKYLKESNSKSDVVLYVILISIAIAIGVYYYSNINGKTLADIVINWFNLGGM